MKKILITMWALVLTGSFAEPQQPPPTIETCAVDPLPLPTHTELDPKPARYTGTFCAPGDTCVTPVEDDPDYVLSDAGATITYHDQGQLYTHECPAGSPNAYWFEEDQWVKHDAPICWKREPVKTSECS